MSPTPNTGKLRRLGARLVLPVRPLRRGLQWIWSLQHRERTRLWAEMAQVRGLMPLLMKPRNGEAWTDADRKKIRAQLRRLASISPYLVLFLAPGGLVALPVLVWWLDRRRQRRDGERDADAA